MRGWSHIDSSQLKFSCVVLENLSIKCWFSLSNIQSDQVARSIKSRATSCDGYLSHSTNLVVLHVLNAFLSKTSRNSWYSKSKTFFITTSDFLCFSKCFFTSFKMTENKFTFFLLLIMLNVDVSIIAMFISDNDFFFFELEISSSLSLSLKSLIALKISIVLLTDLIDFLSFRKRLFVDWSIDWSKQISFRKRTLMTIFFDSLESLIESPNFEWFDWFKKDFFSKKMFFSLFDDDVVFVFILLECVQNFEENSKMFVFSW
jgi:hypothetical protein